MTNKRTLSKEIYYHIYNRGFNKQTLFFEEDDYERFFNTIDRYKKDKKYKDIKILSYCILPNHFHFLMREISEENLSPGSTETLDLEPGLDFCLISEFMNRIQLSYAMYFNSKYGDTVKKGLKLPVFEGRFKAKEILNDEYLAQVTQYIEWNAVKHEIVEKPEEWLYTSYKNEFEQTLLELEEDFDPFFK